MMKLGFVSAILPELSLEEVLSLAAEIGYDCVEVMCWPSGKATRRYAGVTHIDVANLKASRIKEIVNLQEKTGVSISGLGYYPNPLSPVAGEAKAAVEQIRKVIRAADQLGLRNINSFVGRDWTKSVENNWKPFLRTWKPLVKLAEKHDVKIGIENCPMLFTKDEWPGGKNLATTPQIWERMFSDLNSDYFGLNFDPSHFIWQHMDYLQAIKDFGHKFYHVHAKDARIDQNRLKRRGVMAHPNEYHTPKLPGLGDVDWGMFFSYLTDSGYSGAVCVEVEDRAFEGSLTARKSSLRHSYNYLHQYIARALS